MSNGNGSNPNASVDVVAALERMAVLAEAKRDTLKARLRIAHWQSAEGWHSPEQARALQAGWETAEVPYTWSPRDGARTFHLRLELPDAIMGIALAGSQASLELMLTIGAVVSVNGAEAYNTPYWADTQVVPIALSERLAGAAGYDLALQCRQGDGFGYFNIAELCVSAVDEWVLRLDTFAEEMRFVRLLLTEQGLASPECLDGAAGAVGLFDEAAFAGNRWDRVEASLAAVRASLSGFFGQAAKKLTVHLVAHAHIDMNWLWPTEETVDLIRRDFDSMIGLMREYPDVCFSHSQAATYRIAQERFPGLFAEVKRLIAEGRWEVTAATWVEGDLNMAGYETLARQFLEAGRYAERELGVRSAVGWEPDTFGHPASLPQLLAQAGIRYYYHARGGHGIPAYRWEGIDGSRVLAFCDPCHYNGRIFASRLMEECRKLAADYGVYDYLYVFGIGDHGGGATRRDIRRALKLMESPLLPRMRFSTAADYFACLERYAERLPVVRGESRTIFEGCYTSHGDIKRANRRAEHALVRAETAEAALAVYRLTRGCSPGEPVAEAELREAWRTQCFHQFHDILCGCAIRSTYEEAVPASGEIARTADRLTSRLLTSTVRTESSPGEARRTDRSCSECKPTARPGSGSDEGAPDRAGTTGSGSTQERVQALDGGTMREDAAGRIVVRVFNSLSWERTDVVSLSKREFPATAEWRTGDTLREPETGRRHAIQCTEDETLVLVPDVPAFGFKDLLYFPDRRLPERNGQAATAADRPAYSGSSETNEPEPAAADFPLTDAGDLLLSGFAFDFAVDRESGTISGMRHIASGRELSYAAAARSVIEADVAKSALNLFEVHDEAPHAMSAWKIGTVARIRRQTGGAKVTPGHQGPVMRSVFVVHRTGNIVVRQEIRAYAGLDRVDFVTGLEWGESGSGTQDGAMLKVIFRPKLRAAEATFDVPFAAIRRDAEGSEVPAVHWIDLSETGGDAPFGLSLLNNGKFGHAVEGNRMSLTLARSFYEPDNRGDEGTQSFVYSLLPHAGGWREAETGRRALELNQPLVAVPHNGLPEQSPFGALHIEELSACGWRPARGLIATAFKRAGRSETGVADDVGATGNTVVLARLFETHGKPRTSGVRLRLPVGIVRAEETNLLEQSLADSGRVSVRDGYAVIALLPSCGIITLLIEAERGNNRP